MRSLAKLTNFPLSLTDMGFSTTTVWVWDGGVDCWKKVKPMNIVSIISSIKFYKTINLITHSGCRGHWPRRGCSIWQVSWERHPSIAHLQMEGNTHKIKCQYKDLLYLTQPCRSTHINVSNELANSASNRGCTVRIHEGCSTVPTIDMRRLIGGWGCCQIQTQFQQTEQCWWSKRQILEDTYIYTRDKVDSLTARASYAACPTGIHKHCAAATTYNVSHVHPCMSCVQNPNQVIKYNFKA